MITSPQELKELTSILYHILELTILMVFLYGIKRKMYIYNLTGFITICMMGLSFILAYIVPKEYFELIHYSLITLLLLFIVFYGVYKTHKRNCYV